MFKGGYVGLGNKKNWVLNMFDGCLVLKQLIK